MTDVWQPGKTYVPGSIVRPSTVPPAALADVTNGSFETGNFTSWNPSVGTWAVVGGGFAGGFMAKITSNGFGQLLSTQRASIAAGATINATVMARFNNSGVDDKSTRLFIDWFDASGVFISTSAGGGTLTGVGGEFKPVTVTTVAPPSAAKAAIHLEVNNGTHGGNIDIDAFSWSSSISGAPVGLLYKATQANPGKSGATEPAWPNTTGVPVTDNQVTWEGVIATQLVWEAEPINLSGATEPVWPTQPGSSVYDNGIVWVAKSTAIADANCPHSKIVVIASSKVYAADGDIIRYCATVNPLDWSAKNDAGYLPFGLQTYGSNPVAAMNLYRSNLVAFSSEGFQMWQVDEDPANTALLDALPIASTHHLAASPVSNDLLFLAAEGVRSMGIAAASTNLQGADVGMPVDPLVKQAVANAEARGIKVISTYVPSLGQYWLTVSEFPPGPPSVTGDAPNGFVNANYNFTYTATGGIGPYTFRISAGSLPPGLTLTTDGQLIGRPTTPGSYSWTVMVTDSAALTGTDPDSASIGTATVAQFFNTSDCLSTPFAEPILGGGDFTVECVASFDDLSHETNALVSGRAVNVRGWALQIQGGLLNFRQSVGSINIDTTANLQGGTVQVNRLYHMAATRKGDVFKLWLDGHMVDTKTISGAMNESGVTLLTIGTSFFAIREACLKGYMQWFALTVGTARYDADFVPPMSAASIPGATSAIDFNAAIGSTTFTDHTGRTWTTYGDVVSVAYPY